MDVVITTICSAASYANGNANTVLDAPFSRVLSYGSSLSSKFATAGSDLTIAPAVFSAYDSVYRAYEVLVYNAASFGNADAANLITAETQLLSVLQAYSNTAAAQVNAFGFASFIYHIQVLQSGLNIAINNRLSSISCDKQNSLFSIGTDLSTEFSIVRSSPWLRQYFLQSVAWNGVSSVSCPDFCVTATATSESTTMGDSTTQATEAITSSRTVSGSIQRCLVRPTSISSSGTITTSETTSTPSIITVTE